MMTMHNDKWVKLISFKGSDGLEFLIISKT